MGLPEVRADSDEACLNCPSRDRLWRSVARPGRWLTSKHKVFRVALRTRPRRSSPTSSTSSP